MVWTGSHRTMAADVAGLADWVGWLRGRYPLAHRIPLCWWRHPELVEELTALWLAWRDAYVEKGAPLTAGADWHGRWLPEFLRRIGAGGWNLACEGDHRPVESLYDDRQVDDTDRVQRSSRTAAVSRHRSIEEGSMEMDARMPRGTRSPRGDANRLGELSRTPCRWTAGSGPSDRWLGRSSVRPDHRVPARRRSAHGRWRTSGRRDRVRHDPRPVRRARRRRARPARARPARRGPWSGWSWTTSRAPPNVRLSARLWRFERRGRGLTGGRRRVGARVSRRAPSWLTRPTWSPSCRRLRSQRGAVYGRMVLEMSIRRRVAEGAARLRQRAEDASAPPSSTSSSRTSTASGVGWSPSPAREPSR